MKSRFLLQLFDSLSNAGEQLKRIAMLVIGSMLLFASTLMLSGGAQIYLACRSWPQAPGKITRFKLQPDPKHRRLVALELEYEFSVQGQTHTGQMLSPFVTENRLHVWLARWKAKRYPVGQPISVTYSPSTIELNFVEKPAWIQLASTVAPSLALGSCLIYLFFLFRRRKVPEEVVWKWEQLTQAARNPVARGGFPIVLYGISSCSSLGNLFSVWPRSRIALVADGSEFIVVQGPSTMRGTASSLLTLGIILWSHSAWTVILGYCLLEFKEIVSRQFHWSAVKKRHFEKLGRTDPIDRVVVYGLEPSRNRFWYRIERRQRDEFIEIDEKNRSVAENFAKLANEYQYLFRGDAND